MKELDIEAQQVLRDIKLDAVKLELEHWVEQAEAAKNDWTLLSVDDDVDDDPDDIHLKVTWTMEGAH